MTKNKINIINCEDKFGNMSKISHVASECEYLFIQLEKQCMDHDWYFQYSSDGAEWRRGQQHESKILDTINSIQKYGEDQLDEAMKMFLSYRPEIPSPESYTK